MAPDKSSPLVWHHGALGHRLVRVADAVSAGVGILRDGHDVFHRGDERLETHGLVEVEVPGQLSHFAVLHRDLGTNLKRAGAIACNLKRRFGERNGVGFEVLVEEGTG